MEEYEKATVEVVEMETGAFIVASPEDGVTGVTEVTDGTEDTD